jgi:hypothetical protein
MSKRYFGKPQHELQDKTFRTFVNDLLVGSHLRGISEQAGIALHFQHNASLFLYLAKRSRALFVPMNPLKPLIVFPLYLQPKF